MLMPNRAVTSFDWFNSTESTREKDQTKYYTNNECLQYGMCQYESWKDLNKPATNVLHGSESGSVLKCLQIKVFFLSCDTNL